MFAYIQGSVAECHPTYVVIEASGVGYYIHISLNTYSKINGRKEFKVLTHLVFKEEGQFLYGFASDAERQLFIQLISVSGVGPNTARIILSSLEPESIRSAILYGDDGVFRKVKGVGPKTAQRIIIDLKDKINKDLSTGSSIKSGSSPGFKNEAQAALMALGFTRPQIENAILKIPSEKFDQLPLEDLIKEALKNLA